MPATLLKRCFMCDLPIVRIDKEEWKWAKRSLAPTESEPHVGKPQCWECAKERMRLEPPQVLYPYSVWEVTTEGFRHTLVDAPKK